MTRVLKAGTWVLCLVSGSAACTHTDLSRNAPGHIQLKNLPKEPASSAAEIPDDPGERVLLLSYGVFAGGGARFEDRDVAGDFGIGPEVALDLGQRKHSHYEDDFFVLPDRSFGLRLGLNLLEHRLEPPGAAFGELSYTEELFRLSGGWAWDVDDARHGPQVTLAAGPLYLRASHALDLGTSVHGGLLIYGSHAWIWSQ